MTRSGRYVVMGVCSTGKSHIGAALAQALQGDFIDGDDLHPTANVEKMASGQPLNDADRAPWLDRIGQALSDADPPVVVACSALKKAYRARIRAVADDTVFLHLTGPREVIEQRMQAREGHFMPLSLLDSQLATLEPLDDDEAGLALDISLSPSEIVAVTLARLEAGHDTAGS